MIPPRTLRTIPACALDLALLAQKHHEPAVFAWLTYRTAERNIQHAIYHGANVGPDSMDWWSSYRYRGISAPMYGC